MAEVKVLIRRATINDLKDILRLNYELFSQEHRKFDKSLNLNWTFGKDGRDFFKNAIVWKNNFCQVGEAKNKIVGYLNGGVVKMISWHSRGIYAVLESMFIGKGFRNKGLGTRLVQDFIDWCRRKKVDYLSVTASAGNRPAVNFYKKRGFKEYDLTLRLKLTR